MKFRPQRCRHGCCGWPFRNRTEFVMGAHRLRSNGAAPAVRFAPHKLILQTREALVELSYGAEEIDALLAANAVGSPPAPSSSASH
jgi:hypothetical protein